MLVAMALATALVLGSRPLRGREQRAAAVPASGPADSIPELPSDPVTWRALAGEPREAPGASDSSRREAVSLPNALVAGRVEVEGGMPAGEEARVVGRAHRAGVSRLHSEAFTAPVAPDGSFELRVPEDTRSVGLELDSRVLFLVNEVEVRPGKLDLVLWPRIFAVVRGRVFLPWGVEPSSIGEVRIDVSAGQAHVRADAEGRFELLVEPRMPLTLSAETSERGPRSRVHGSARLELGALRPGEIRAVEVFLEGRYRPRGVVLDEQGAPVKYASVKVVAAGMQPEAQLAQYQTDGRGRFELGSLTKGEWDLSVQARGRYPVTQRLLLPVDANRELCIVLGPRLPLQRLAGDRGGP